MNPDRLTYLTHLPLGILLMLVAVLQLVLGQITTGLINLGYSLLAVRIALYAKQWDERQWP